MAKKRTKARGKQRVQKKRRVTKKRVTKKRPNQTGGMLGTILKESAKLGYQLGKSKDYKRMGRSGVKGTYQSATSDWSNKERAAFNKWRYERDKKEHKATCCIM